MSISQSRTSEEMKVATLESLKSKGDKVVNYPQNCQKCGKLLDPNKMVMVEWNWKTGGPVFGPVDPKDSQGWFPYGKDCAAKLKKNETKGV